MKTFMLSLLMLASVCAARGQGTFQFTAHLTGNTAWVGDGAFSLTGGAFSYFVDIPSNWGFNHAAIYGPAEPGIEAPIVFILGGRHCQVTAPGYPGGCSYRGEQTLSDPQISDLMNGLWYVRAYLGEFPEFYGIRGQITVVPEPSTWILLACGAAALWVARHRLRRNHATCSEPGA